jgi:hypothetical protein
MKYLWICLAVVTMLASCVSPDTRAKRLCREGKYEAVLERYPRQPVGGLICLYHDARHNAAIL